MARTKQTARKSDPNNPNRRQLAAGQAIRKMPETGENEAYVYFSRWIMDMENGSSLVHVPYPKPHTVFVDKKEVPEYMRHVTPRELTMEQYEKYEESIADYDEPFYIDSDHKMIYIEEKYI